MQNLYVYFAKHVASYRLHGSNQQTNDSTTKMVSYKQFSGIAVFKYRFTELIKPEIHCVHLLSSGWYTIILYDIDFLWFQFGTIISPVHSLFEVIGHLFYGWQQTSTDVEDDYCHKLNCSCPNAHIDDYRLTAPTLSCVECSS